MGCGSKPKVDKNIGIAQKQMSDLAVQQNKYFQENFAPRYLDQIDQQTELGRRQADTMEEMQAFEMDRARRFDERYFGVQVPLEDELIGQARKYNTAAEQERMAGEASADVAGGFRNAEGAQRRGLAMRGVNPGSPAAVTAMSDMSTARAVAQASAINKTRVAAREIGWAKLGEAAALGRGLPGFGSQSSQLALGAGQGAVGAGSAGVGALNSGSSAYQGNTNSAGNLWQGVGSLGVQKSQLQAQGGDGGIGGLVGGIAGSFFGPLGSSLGSMAGKWAGGKLGIG